VDIQYWEGGNDGNGFRFGIVASRFNQVITDALLDGALKVLDLSGAQAEDIEVAFVPGAFELPGVAQQMGEFGTFDALICLGAIIRGETPHFQYIAAEVSRGIGQVALDMGLPVIFGVLTTDSIQQAIARSSSENNKGAESAIAAIEMAHLYRDLKGD